MSKSIINQGTPPRIVTIPYPQDLKAMVEDITKLKKQKNPVGWVIFRSTRVTHLIIRWVSPMKEVRG